MFFQKRAGELEIKNSYRSIVELAKRYTDKQTIQEQILMLTYLINSLLDDICTSVIVEPLIKPVMGILQDPFPREYYDENGNSHSISIDKKINVDLSASKIYVRPWNNKRTFDNLKSLLIKDFVFHEENHFSIFYTDINLCYVYNGNHSINAGRYLQKGTILSEEYDISLLYSNYVTDGIYWYDTHSKEVIYKVKDFRLAAVFSLAQMRYKIKQMK